MKVFTNLPDEKKDRVIQVSMSEFAEHGYELASTNRIVNKLNISKGSLFKYFTTKISLYTYLVEYAINDLTNYLKEKFFPRNEDTWKEYLLNHASIEFDYLIKEPMKYMFFRNVVRDINQKALANIKDDILAHTNNYLLSMKKDLKIDEDLFNHLMFIIKGYNEYFLEIMNIVDISENDKNDYMVGLKKHFDYVKE